MASCARERICNPTSARRRAAPPTRSGTRETCSKFTPHGGTSRHPRRRPGVGSARQPLGREDAARASHRSGGAGRGLHDVPSPDTQANVITTDYSDWATNCPEYKVTAVQVSPSNGPSRWQQDYGKFSRQSRIRVGRRCGVNA